eukprot:TRINITY_DN7201_c0_g1_i1.p1 TRINITY_DN7201_c0_g1~~TRINITY_DN7201_c0_g1_i1.p1  ORF type:complete len:121 (+),score=20.32 TRINITY_DN7201_c0_g1_i1:53-415(+)
MFGMDSGMRDLMRRAEQGNGTYHKKVSRVYNPNHQISETRMTENDETVGMETVSLERSLGERRVGITKKRNLTTGEENNLRDLHMVSQDAVSSFDSEWSTVANRSMPSYATMQRQQIQDR